MFIKNMGNCSLPWHSLLFKIIPAFFHLRAFTKGFTENIEKGLQKTSRSTQLLGLPRESGRAPGSVWEVPGGSLKVLRGILRRAVASCGVVWRGMVASCGACGRRGRPETPNGAETRGSLMASRPGRGERETQLLCSAMSHPAVNIVGGCSEALWCLYGVS